MAQMTEASARNPLKRLLSVFCCSLILSSASTPVFAQIIRGKLGGAGAHAGPAAGALSAVPAGTNPALNGGVFSLQGALIPSLSAASAPSPVVVAVPGAPATVLSAAGSIVPRALAAKAALSAAAAPDKPAAPAATASKGAAPAAPSALGAAQELAAAPESGDQASGASPTFDGAELIPFRAKIGEPGVYLLETKGSKDDTLGRRLTASLKTADISAALKANALETLSGKTLYVTGVEMGSEQDALKRVRAAVSGMSSGLDEVKIQILSIPRPRSRGFLRSLRDNIVYFMPSMRRDYQVPLRDEVVSGAISTVILELPNAFYLFAVLPSPDAGIVLAVHTVVLGAYTIWPRALFNWVFRGNGTVQYVKQFLLGLPFVLNYNVFSHYTDLSNFYQAYGISGMLEQLPAKVLEFGVTQGLTLFLQTAFYSWVVTRGFRAWSANQKVPEDAVAARSWVSWLLMPWLWLDSIFMTQAATVSTVLFAWHSFTLTLGHVNLALLTALGSIIVFNPKLLDKTLPAYKRMRAWIARLKGGKVK